MFFRAVYADDPARLDRDLSSPEHPVVDGVCLLLHKRRIICVNNYLTGVLEAFSRAGSAFLIAVQRAVYQLFNVVSLRTVLDEFIDDPAEVIIQQRLGDNVVALVSRTSVYIG